MVLIVLFKCITFLTFMLKSSLQDCPEETLNSGVKWPRSPVSLNIVSTPPCYVNDAIITRDCNGTHWSPSLQDLNPCLQVIKYLDNERICPPGFHRISNNSVSSKYCYSVGENKSWEQPCYGSGGATVITDLNNYEVDSLIASLKEKYDSKYFWLPAQRNIILMPTLWTVPGPNYGQKLEQKNNIVIQTSIWKNCALLDTENRMIVSESCSNSHPSLCIFINDINFPAQCPDNYLALRFTENDGICYGIKFFDTFQLARYSNTDNPKCAKLMGDDRRHDSDVMRFLFHKISTVYSIPDSEWCLFAQSNHPYDVVPTMQLESNQSFTTNDTINNIFINNAGTLNFQAHLSNLTCLACMSNTVQLETEIIFEYNINEEKIYLSIYNPSSLWKYESIDKGVQCFSNTYGPVSIVHIRDEPVFHNLLQKNKSDSTFVEKIVYVIEVSNQITGEYWCIGHTKNFSMISTDKILVSPRGNDIHVFSLVIQIIVHIEDKMFPDFGANLISSIMNIFQVDNVLLMDILEYNEPYLLIVLHLQVQITKIYDDEGMNILEKYNSLKEIAETILPTYNYTLVNISSATHCLPTTSNKIFKLHWNLTKLHQVTAPKEFCLQENGLPVQRNCLGTYVLGAYWGEVIGICNFNYVPSKKTTYLYDFVRSDVQQNDTARFLTDGLTFVLDDVDIIIPADIYYLAMSLQQIRELAYRYESSIEMCKVKQMTWAMNRIMDLQPNYLHLAQTLNSSNVILDTIDDIIKLITWENRAKDTAFNETGYEIAVEPNYMVQISHPQLNSISGLALSTISKNNADFTKMLVQPLYQNTTLESVLAIQNLEVAAWIPEHLLNTLRKNISDTTFDQVEDVVIIISVFYDDVIFQRIDKPNSIVNGRIISVSIPGYISNLEYPLPLIFKENYHVDNKSYCVFWDFRSNLVEEFETGTWSNKGCFMVKIENNLTICQCYHLTHFGHLISINPLTSTPDHLKHMKTLNFISLIGCFLSILGIFGIWITALIFKVWRRKPGTKILLQLSLSIAITLIIFTFLNIGNSLLVEEDHELHMNTVKRILCTTLGVILQYSVLVSFMWMLITGILQYLRFVKVLGGIRPSRFMIKSSLAAWGVPCIPVAIVLIVDMENYIPPRLTYGYAICYPRGTLLFTCVTFPIILILIINISIFVRIIIATSRGLDRKKKKADIDLIYAQMRLSIFLFFLFGLTWIFAIFSFSDNLIWSYLFCISGTLQGLVLFIYFIICDPNTRNLWVTLIKPQFVTSVLKDSISDTSLSTS